jgi:hypothetical protein
MTWPMHPHCSPPMPGCCVPQPAWFYYPVACVPIYCAPPAQECCEEECDCKELTVPQQIDATGDIKPTALVGGHDDVHLTLEYLVEKGATNAKVTVTAVQPDGATSTWTDTGIAVGFHVQEKFLTVKPGTQVNLEVGSVTRAAVPHPTQPGSTRANARPALGSVTGVTARLRWCETICC